MESGRWQRLPTDEQVFWLREIEGFLGPKGLDDSNGWHGGDQDIVEIQELLSAQREGLRRGR